MHDSQDTVPAHRAGALEAARDAAVACDLEPLRVLAVTGSDAAAFLQGQLSCDVSTLTPDACRYGSFSSPKGRLLANFVLWRGPPGEDGFALLLAGDIAESIAKRLRMYVLRSKVTIADVSGETRRVGIGGPDAATALRAVLEVVPALNEARHLGGATVLGLPGHRFVVLARKGDTEGGTEGDTELLARFATVATPAGFEVWRWLTIRSGTPVITAATQDAFVAQAANLDLLGGIDFRKGCYTGQEIIARTQYLGRLKERTYLFHTVTGEAKAADRIYSPVFEGQPCGTVINAAPAPGGGSDLLAVLQIAAAEHGDPRLHAPEGPRLAALPLPYAIPAPAVPRGRGA